MDEGVRQARLFAGLDNATWPALQALIGERTYAPKDVVFHEGDPGTSLYIVLDGKVKISKTAVDGRENLLAVLGPGDLFGELSLFDDEPRSATATAVVDSKLATLTHDDYRRWLDEYPVVAAPLLRALAGRLRQTNEAMADLIFTDVPGRVAKTLMSMAERFGEESDEGLRVTHDLTQEELAQLVGASRETVNKALSDFATRGWIKVDGKAVVLIDRERLDRRAR